MIEDWMGPRREMTCLLGCVWALMSVEELNDFNVFALTTQPLVELNATLYRDKQERTRFFEIMALEAIARPLIVEWNDKRLAAIKAARDAAQGERA